MKCPYCGKPYTDADVRADEGNHSGILDVRIPLPGTIVHVIRKGGFVAFEMAGVAQCGDDLAADLRWKGGWIGGVVGGIMVDDMDDLRQVVKHASKAEIGEICWEYITVFERERERPEADQSNER